MDENMSYKKDLKKVMILYPELSIHSSDDYRHLINIHNTMETIFGEELDLNIVRASYNRKSEIKKLGSKNDYFYLVISTALKSQGFKKLAYPTIDDKPFQEEYDLEKWSQIVYDIYNDVEENKVNFSEAVNHHAKRLVSDKNPSSKSESEDFKRWLKYYNKGENKKYSNEEDALLKNADFGLTPSGVAKYTRSGTGYPMGIRDSNNETTTGYPSGITTPDKIENYIIDNSAKNSEYQKWIKGLHRTIRSIDNRIRVGSLSKLIGDKKALELLNLLHNLSTQVLSISNEKTAVDLTLKYANKFKKLGFEDGFSQLTKYAQAAEAGSVDDLPETPQESSGASTEVPSDKAATVAPTEAAKPPEGDLGNSSTPLERALAPVTEAKEGEYESLAGDVGLSDAVSKLEDIAGRLSDRRTIRLLAEFDIILDKIGIAPMFPELAEAQSKLIDAYSYALTRVTKMLGMLSSGKSILEISESKKNELVGKTMKEVNKGIADGEAAAAAAQASKAISPPPVESSRGAESIQEDLEAAGLAGESPEGSKE
jgi:hypothetical protein